MYKAKNNAVSTLAIGISDSATSMQVASGHGDRFPVIIAPDYTLVTLSNGAGSKEIVKVTARGAASDTMTIVRAQEGTSALSWVAGVVIENRQTAGLMEEAMSHIDEEVGAHAASAIANTPAGNIAATTVQAAINELDTEKEPTITVLPVAKGGTGVTSNSELISNLGIVTQTPGSGQQTVLGSLGVSALPIGPTDVVNKEALDKAVSLRPLERQTVISGKLSASGAPAFLNGTGANRSRLLLDTNNGDNPLAVSAAVGFGSDGQPIDETLTTYSDVPQVLPASLPDNSQLSIAYSAEPVSTPAPSAATLRFFNKFTSGLTTDQLVTTSPYVEHAHATHSPSVGVFTNGSLTTSAEGQTASLYGNAAASIADSMSGTVELFMKTASSARNALYSYTESAVMVFNMTLRTAGGIYGRVVTPMIRAKSLSNGAAYRLELVDNATLNEGLHDWLQAGPFSISFDVFHHVAFTYSFTPVGNEASVSFKIYVDGALYLTKDYTTTFGNLPSPISTCLAQLSSINIPTNLGVSHIDNFAWHESVIYTSTFTPPAAEYLINTVSSNFFATEYKFQYGREFVKNRNALLRFAGASSEIEDFGSVWSNFGTASPSGGRVTFDGASMYLQSAAYTILGQNEWTIEFVVSATMGAANSVDNILSIGQSSTNFGLLLQSLTNASATAQNLRIYLSSDGTTHDIASAVVSGTVLPSGSDTHVAIVFNGSNYKVYQNGSEVISVTSSKRLTNFSRIRIGWDCAGTAAQYLNGSMTWFRLLQGTALYRAAFAAVLAKPTAVEKVFWFNSAQMMMYVLSGPAETAGGNPVFTARKVVELGEVVTAGAGVDTTVKLLDYRYSANPSSASPSSAKAWVSFDGTGTVSVKSSFNVSSITDNGAGDWTINFASPMRNNNYIAVGNVGYGELGSGAETAASLLIPRRGTAKSVSSLRIGTVATDYPEVMVAVFGE